MVARRRVWAPFTLLLVGCSGCYDWEQFRFRSDGAVNDDDAALGVDAWSVDAAQSADAAVDAPGDAPSIDANLDAARPRLCTRNAGALYCDDYEGSTRPTGTTIGAGCSVFMSGGRRAMQCETSGIEAALRLTPTLPTTGDLYVRFSAQVLEGDEYFRLFRLGALGPASLGVFPDGSEGIALEAPDQPSVSARVSLREQHCYVLHLVLSATAGRATLSRDNEEVATSAMTWGRVGSASSIYLGITEHDGLGRTRVLLDDVVVRRIPMMCD